MGTVKTIAVIRRVDGAECIINVGDFDSELYTLPGESDLSVAAELLSLAVDEGAFDQAEELGPGLVAEPEAAPWPEPVTDEPQVTNWLEPVAEPVIEPGPDEVEDSWIANRIAELEVLYSDKGYGAIRSLGEELGVSKDPDGWQATIPAIAAVEYQTLLMEQDNAGAGAYADDGG